MARLGRYSRTIGMGFDDGGIVFYFIAGGRNNCVLNSTNASRTQPSNAEKAYVHCSSRFLDYSLLVLPLIYYKMPNNQNK